ncbi:MAG: flagellar motor switch protein FliG [Phycisphaerales bacterium]
MRNGTKLPTSAADLRGTQKAAILMISLDEEAASEVLKHLSAEQVEDLMRIVASMGEISPELAADVVEEFYGLRLAAEGSREGGMEYASLLLKQSLDPKMAARVIGQIQTQVQKTPFAFLQKAESENLLTFIEDEHPQTIALIMSYLSYHKASDILARLPEQKQIEVVRRVAVMDQTNPDVIREVEHGLETRLSNMLSTSVEKVGGVDTVAEILNLIDRGTEKQILEGIETDDPDLVEDIRKLMFVFEDINLINDRGIQAILKEVDNDELCLALKTASDELRNKIFGNMSQRAAELIKEDMEYMGPVRMSDVEQSQQRVVDTVRRLEEAGEIVISGRGADKDMVV